jgi:hypothetical protein
MKDSRLTIQRPEGCPEWAELGVMVIVRVKHAPLWEGPYPLAGYDANDQTFRAEGEWWNEAKPYIKWQPETGEWCAFWDAGARNYIVKQYKDNRSLRNAQTLDKIPYDHVARLVDDNGNLIDLRCSVEELKERTEWL